MSDSNPVKTFNARIIYNSNKRYLASKNWKFDWAKWSENSHNNSNPQLTSPNRCQDTRVFTTSRRMPGKIHGNKSLVSQKSCVKNPASGNNSISKASQMVKANLSSVVSGHSISLHNRLDMFHNTALFPENGCKSVTCDQKVV